MAPVHILDESTYAHGLDVLSHQDPDLARILTTFGPPPLWRREPGFTSLLNIIIGQQVSLASARAVSERLARRVDDLTPAAFLALGDEELRGAGFSRQKMRYGRELASAIQRGDLDLAALAQEPDEVVRRRLLPITGIGPWTAEIYLLMALGRRDAWPESDLAILVAVQQIKQLATRPTQAELADFSATWQPWRGVAARLLWHHYLGGMSPI